MKKTILCAAMTVMFLLNSCQKDNAQEETSVLSQTQKENWQTVDLDAEFASSQKQVTAYLFSTEKISELVNTPNISEIRFVLGYDDASIQIDAVGVDKSGNELGTVSSTILKEADYDAQLSKLNRKSVKSASKRSALLNEHLVRPQEAFDGIQAWQEKLSTVSDLDEITSYEGKRFTRFSIEYEIVEALVNKSNKNIGLFLGLNPNGKVTTFLIGLNKDNAIKKASLTAKNDLSDPSEDDGDVYDGVRPSPPF